MERRPAPEVTIEGGPGWQIDAPRETVDAEAPEARRREARRIGALVLAAAVGFAAATALADVRTTTLAESDDGVLSLEVQRDPVDSHDAGLVADGDGRPALVATVTVRNTGPRPIALERAELVGTPYRSGDLAGRRVADGGQAVLTLLRAVDCSRTDPTPAPGPLRVTATTGAGTRTVDLRMTTDLLAFHDDQARGACGQSPPAQALVLGEQRGDVDGSRYLLGLTLSNASSRPLLLTGVDVHRGLRLVEVRDEQGGATALPLDLVPGDYDPPVDVFAGRGPERTAVFVLEVDDCARLPGPRSDPYLPVVELRVSDLDGRTGSAGVGHQDDRLQDLLEAACGVPAGAVVRPSLAEVSEQALHALRRDHPFLTPD